MESWVISSDVLIQSLQRVKDTLNDAYYQVIHAQAGVFNTEKITSVRLRVKICKIPTSVPFVQCACVNSFYVQIALYLYLNMYARTQS